MPIASSRLCSFSLAALGLLASACTTTSTSDDAGHDAAIFVSDGSGRLDSWPPPDAWRPPPVDAGPLDDAQILGVMRAMHASIIAEAQFALTQPTRTEVRDLANRLIAAHMADDAALASIESTAGIAPVATSESTDIADATSADIARLGMLGCVDLDLQYPSGAHGALGAFSARLGQLRGQAMLPALVTEIDAEISAFGTEAFDAENTTLAGGFPEAGMSCDAGPPVDAYFDVGPDS